MKARKQPEETTGSIGGASAPSPSFNGKSWDFAED